MPPFARVVSPRPAVQRRSSDMGDDGKNGTGGAEERPSGPTPVAPETRRRADEALKKGAKDAAEKVKITDGQRAALVGRG